MPGETQVYCGHEYTLSNARFALTVDPDNNLLAERATEVEEMRKQGRPTLPTTLNCPQTGQFGTPPSNPTLTLCSPFTAANASQTNTPTDAVSFGFNGAQRNLNAVTANVYGATVPSNPTNAGY